MGASVKGFSCFLMEFVIDLLFDFVEVLSGGGKAGVGLQVGLFFEIAVVLRDFFLVVSHLNRLTFFLHYLSDSRNKTGNSLFQKSKN